MRRLLAVLLALLMLLALTTVVYADDDPPESARGTGLGSEEQMVKIQLDEGVEEDAAIYHITIAWDSLVFKYETGAWNPDSMNYGVGEWANRGTEENSFIYAKIEVTNKSNRKVWVDRAWENAGNGTVNGNECSYGGATFTLNVDPFALESASNGIAKASSFTVTPSGDPGKFPGTWSTTARDFHTVIVTISDTAPPAP